MEDSKSSTIMAAVNLAKLCVGAGVLAIPYSFLQGGLLFSPIGIGAIAAWNGVSCMMIMRCKRMIDCDSIISYPSQISSTFAKIAYVALGWKGVYITDFAIIFTLLGVCVSYQIAFISLFQDVPINIFTAKQLAIISAILVYPMSCVRDVSVLSIVSLIGLIILILGILSIFIFGISMYEQQGANHHIQHETISHMPRTITDLTSFIGVAVFCFGLSSLAFPVEESMKHKHEFGKAVLWSLIFVWTTYVVVGDGIAWLYSYDVAGVKSNILQNLPTDSMIAAFVRISMSIVCLLTYPLTLVPPAQMIEHVLQSDSRWLGILSCSRRSYDPIQDHSIYADDHYQGSESVHCTSYLLRLIVRGCLVIICAILAAFVPCFAMVVSLLGCFTVTILSFVLPPILHLIIVTKPILKGTEYHYNILSFGRPGSPLSNPPTLVKVPVNQYIVDCIQHDRISPRNQYYIDILLSLCGVLICIVATAITAIGAINTIASGDHC